MKRNSTALSLAVAIGLLFGNALPIAQPAFINAALPLPAAPTPSPSPVDPGAAGWPSGTPPPPDRLPSHVEEAQAREAIEAVLQKYLNYWGPRYQVAPLEVSVQGEWAVGVAQWRGAASMLSGPIHLLARRLPDGAWHALMPGDDALYLEWLDSLPETLIPAGEKAQLRTQAAEAAALRLPQAATPTPEQTIPPNQPERGLIYDGLERDADGPCRGLYRIRGTTMCTHGPDPAPPGVDIQRSAPPLQLAEEPSILDIICDGDGVSGRRTQVIYARASDRPDRFNAYLASIRQWASDADSIYQNSAAETAAAGTSDL